ncbi:MAG: transposase, partial [Candidatus Portiera sp.]|nr:transposase [Portiera sp.]
RKVYRGTSDLEKQKIRQGNNQLNKVRCKVEHIYGVIKSKFGYRKVKYQGVKKNAQNIAALLAFANLYLASPKLIQMQT